MEDLVEAERVRPRVRPLAGVDDRAGAVEQAAGGEQDDGCHVERADELRRRDDGEPAEREVAAGDERARRVDPAQRERDAGQRAAPGAEQQHPGDGPVEDDQRDRRVAGGDEDEDHAVVDAPQQRLEAPRPGPAVVERRAAEEGDEADAVDDHRDGRARAVGEDEQDDGRGDGEQAGGGVRDAAQAGDELFGGVGLHGLFKGRAGRERRGPPVSVHMRDANLRTPQLGTCCDRPEWSNAAPPRASGR